MKTLFSILAAAMVAGIAAAAPVNTECPVAAKPAKPGCKTTYKGQEVAFCCGKCKAKFEAEPEKYASKLPAKK